LLRVTLIFGALFVISLFLVIRAMAGAVRKDRMLGHNRKSGRPFDFRPRLVGAAVAIAIGVGFYRHQWNTVIAASGPMLGIAGLLWLDKTREGAISRGFLALFERGPTSDIVWFRAAAGVGVVFLLDTFITGEWRFSPGLAIALIWCLGWGVLTHHVRHRSQIDARAV
jgi:hypothetical protein